MFSILWTIIIGFVVGLIARAIKPGDDKIGWLWTIGLGIGGSFFAKILGQAVGWYKDGQSAGFIASVLGAVVLLAGYSLIKRKRS